MLDENLPRKLRRELPDFFVRTVQEEGWTSYANGELLGRAQGTFDALLTADRRLQFQQNLARFDIGIVVIVTVSLRFRIIRSAIIDIRAGARRRRVRRGDSGSSRRYEQDLTAGNEMDKNRVTLADRFAEIREVFRQEKAHLRILPRRDRKNDFVSVLDELAGGHKRSHAES